MFVRWPDGPVAMPWPRSGRTVRRRRRARRSEPRRQCRLCCAAWGKISRLATAIARGWWRRLSSPTGTGGLLQGGELRVRRAHGGARPPGPPQGVCTDGEVGVHVRVGSALAPRCFSSPFSAVIRTASMTLRPDTRSCGGATNACPSPPSATDLPRSGVRERVLSRTNSGDRVALGRRLVGVEHSGSSQSELDDDVGDRAARSEGPIRCPDRQKDPVLADT